MGRAQPRTAIVSFRDAREAERRVAGVASAARIVRELSKSGLSECWLVLPPGSEIGARALDDVRRLAGAMSVHVTDAPPPAIDGEGEGPLRLDGTRLISAEALPALLAGNGDAVNESFPRLDSRGASFELLRRSGKVGDGPVSRWLNRPLSRRISALLLRIPGIRPIHATAGTALLAALMVAALIGGGTNGLLAGALLYQAASIFDGVDGELARVTFRASPRGAVLDSAVDVATNLGFVIGLTINLAWSGHDAAVVLAAWGFGLCVLGLAAIAWRTSRVNGPFSLDLVKHHYRHRFGGRMVPLLIRAATIVSSRDFYALLFMLLVIAGLPMVVLYLFAATATVWILFVIGSMRIGRGDALASRRA